MTPQTFTLTYPWDVNGYKPYAEYELGMDDKGFLMRITVCECDPRRVETEHQRDIYMDSCAEWFVNFAPEICDRYLNFEVNANGAMHVAFRKDRHEGIMLTDEDIAVLDIHTKITGESCENGFRFYSSFFCCISQSERTFFAVGDTIC